MSVTLCDVSIHERRITNVRFQNGLWEIEVLEYHKCSRARLTVEVMYAVNLSIKRPFKVHRK